MRMTRSQSFFIVGTIVLLAYSACNSSTPTTPTPDPTPQPTSFNVTVNFTSGTGGGGIDVGGPMQRQVIIGDLVITIVGGNGSANDVVATLTGELFDSTPFMLTEDFGTINGSETRTFTQQFDSPYPPPDPLFRDLEVEVVGSDPVTGEPIMRNVNPDDIGPDRTDTFFPPPCDANSNTACLFDKRFKVTTEFDGKPGVKLASGQKSADTWDAIFGRQGSSSGDVYLDIIDRCQTNGYFRTDVSVSTDDDIKIIFYDEETGVWREFTHPEGSPPSQTTVSKALVCSTTPTPTPTVSTTPTPAPTTSIRRGR